MFNIQKNWRIFKSGKFVMNGIVVAGMLVAATSANAANTLPTNGNFVSGTGTINTAGTDMTVSHTGNSIIEWDTFSIGDVNLVNILNGGAATLNRVVGTAYSAIHGKLQSDGDVFLINQNGVLVSETGSVDVGGTFVASSLDITNADFLNGGINIFNDTAGLKRSVKIKGDITSTNGDVILVSRDRITVRNGATITADNGNVLLGNGSQVTIKEGTANRVAVAVGDVNNIKITDATITGGAVEVVSGKDITLNPYAIAINLNNSVLKANAIVNGADGSVELSSSGGRVQIANSTLESTNNVGGTANVLVKVNDDASVTSENNLRIQGNVNINAQGGDVIITAPNVFFANSETTTLNVDASKLDLNASYVDAGGDQWDDKYGFNSNFTAANAGTINATGDIDIDVDGDFAYGTINAAGEVNINAKSGGINGDLGSIKQSELVGSGINAGSIVLIADDSIDATVSASDISVKTDPATNADINIDVVDSSYTSGVSTINLKAVNTAGNVNIDDSTSADILFTNGSSSSTGDFNVTSTGNVLIDNTISSGNDITISSGGNINYINPTKYALEAVEDVTLTAAGSIKATQGEEERLRVSAHNFSASSTGAGDIRLGVQAYDNAAPLTITSITNSDGNIVVGLKNDDQTVQVNSIDANGNVELAGVNTNIVVDNLNATGYALLEAAKNNTFTGNISTGGNFEVYSQGDIIVASGATIDSSSDIYMGSANSTDPLLARSGDIRIDGTVSAANGTVSLYSFDQNGGDVYTTVGGSIIANDVTITADNIGQATGPNADPLDGSIEIQAANNISLTARTGYLDADVTDTSTDGINLTVSNTGTGNTILDINSSSTVAISNNNIAAGDYTANVTGSEIVVSNTGVNTDNFTINGTSDNLSISADATSNSIGNLNLTNSGDVTVTGNTDADNIAITSDTGSVYTSNDAVISADAINITAVQNISSVDGGAMNISTQSITATATDGTEEGIINISNATTDAGRYNDQEALVVAINNRNGAVVFNNEGEGLLDIQELSGTGGVSVTTTNLESKLADCDQSADPAQCKDEAIAKAGDEVSEAAVDFADLDNKPNTLASGNTLGELGVQFVAKTVDYTGAGINTLAKLAGNIISIPVDILNAIAGDNNNQ